MAVKPGSTKKADGTHCAVAVNNDALIAELNHRIAALENELRSKQEGPGSSDVIGRRRAEETLKEKEPFLSNLFASIQDGISVLDRDLNIVSVNPVMEKWYGEGIAGKKCYAVYHGRSCRCEKCPGIRAMREKTTQTEVVRDIRTWVEIYAFPYVNSEGEVTGVIEQVRDITERKRAEAALLESEQRLRLCIATARLGTFEWDAVNDRHVWSPETYEIYGVRPGTTITMDYLKNLIYPGDEQDNVFAAGLDPKRPGGYTMEYRIRRASDGEVRWVYLMTRVLFEGEGKGRHAVRLLGAVQDITERKQAEEVMRATMQRFYTILSNMHGAILLVTEGGRIEYANDMYCNFFNLSERPADLVGLTVPEISEKSRDSYRDPDQTLARVQEIVERWEPVVGGEVAMRDGRTFLYDFIPMSIGVKRYGQLWHLIDITERKKIEKTMVVAKAQAELYLDLMGHDISNMHQIALGYLELALQTLEMDGRIRPDGRVLIEKPFQVLQGSSRLISNVRKLQRLADEGVKARRIDLHDLFEEIRTLDFHTGDRDATINVHEVPHCVVEGSDLIRDVFFNLVSNAVKHAAPERPVMVDVMVELVDEGGRAYCRCAVEDDGPGVPDELKPKLFQRFQRGKTKAHGKGLGLYLVKSLVDSYGGNVWVEDRVPGDHTKGARFVVMLPTVDA